MKKTTKKLRKYRVPLQAYIAIVFIAILCVSCILSFSIVSFSFGIFFRESFSTSSAKWMILFTCLLTICFGTLFMFFGSIHLSKPLQILTKAVKKITEGDFSVRITRRKDVRKGYPFTNEIDELSVHFNLMANELEGMQIMRKDFMNNVSHELQTPVSAIAGITELLTEGNLSQEDTKEYLSILNDESIRMSRLCTNMLELSRLDNQKIPQKQESIQIAEQIRKTIILLNEKWTEKSCYFDLELEDVFILANKDLLKELWINLIDNAIKYSGDEVHIKIKEYYKDGTLFFDILDDGIGIEQHKIDKIFDQFYQCDESHKHIGNGLGLSIVKKIVDLYHGEIVCSSEIEKGTFFHISLQVLSTKNHGA